MYSLNINYTPHVIQYILVADLYLMVYTAKSTTPYIAPPHLNKLGNISSIGLVKKFFWVFT